MNFSLLENLNQVSNELDVMATAITESTNSHPDRITIMESADTVLGTLVAKLKFGKLQAQEYNEYAQLYASLSLLAQETTRQAYNIDITTPTGKQKFANIVNKTGDDTVLTDQVKKVATVNGQSHYQQILKDLQNFSIMKPAQQQQYLNNINKLRLGYERAKNLANNKPNAIPSVSNGATASTSNTQSAGNSPASSQSQSIPSSTVM